MTIAMVYDIEELTHKREPMKHHLARLQWTHSGYGRRIPTVWMVKLPDNPRWRRVYVCIYGNAGTSYVQDRKTKNWTVITGGCTCGL